MHIVRCETKSGEYLYVTTTGDYSEHMTRSYIFPSLSQAKQYMREDGGKACIKRHNFDHQYNDYKIVRYEILPVVFQVADTPAIRVDVDTI